jgi:hypothetical protein
MFSSVGGVPWSVLWRPFVTSKKSVSPDMTAHFTSQPVSMA